MNKKGVELTLSTVVTIVLLVAAFLILLFIYNQFSFSGTVNNEVCHQSVIFRATLPATAGVQNYVPLKCQTQKICITSGLFAGRCADSFQDTKGVTIVKVKSLENVEKTVAQSILECWTMMGEGKLTIFQQWMATTSGIGGIHSSCVVCDRIAFDKESLKKAGIDLTKMNVVDYMKTRAVPDEAISYAQRIIGNNGLYSLNGKSTISNKAVDSNGNTVDMDVDLVPVSNVPVPEDSYYKDMGILFMQIVAPPNGGQVFVNTLQQVGLAVGASFALAPGTTIEVSKALGKLCTSNIYAGIICGVIVLAGIGYQQGQVAHSREVASGLCGDVKIGSESRNGCSVVRAVEYNETDIKQYCGVIESIS
jgi:hypothetical protein